MLERSCRGPREKRASEFEGKGGQVDDFARNAKLWISSALLRAPFCLAGLVLSALALLAVTQEATAQAFRPELRSKQSEIKGLLKEGNPISADMQQTFNDYFNFYAIPLFLNSKSDDLQKARTDFHRSYFVSATGPPRVQLLKLSLDKFKKVLTTKVSKQDPLRDNYLKYNVLLAVGELNEAEKTKPYKPALDVLLPFAQEAKDGKTNGPRDSLRAAALVGIAHQAETQGLPADSKAAITKALLPLVQKREPPKGRELAVNDALRSRAIECLALQRSPADLSQLVKTFDAIVSDPAESAKMRCKAAIALGSLDYGSDTKIDLQALADHIGHMAVDICKHEQTQARKKQIQFGTIAGDIYLRRLKTWVHDALEGLSGENRRTGLLGAANKPEQKKFIEKVVAKLKDLDKLLGEGEFESKQLSAKLTDLEKTLQPRAVAPAKALDKREVDPGDKPTRVTSAGGRRIVGSVEKAGETSRQVTKRAGSDEALQADAR